MRILFDHGVPAPLRNSFADHIITTAYEMGWAPLDNGALLSVVEGAFDVLVTTDQNLEYQQNLVGRRLAVLVLPTTSWPRLQAHIPEIVEAVGRLRPGDFRKLIFRT